MLKSKSDSITEQRKFLNNDCRELFLSLKFVGSDEIMTICVGYSMNLEDKFRKHILIIKSLGKRPVERLKYM
jgi:hypothetical protein